MHLNPQESRKAHSQIGSPVRTAGSSSSQLQDSPESCDLRGPQLASCVEPTMPANGFEFSRWLKPDKLRSVRPIDPIILRRIFDDEARPAPILMEPPTWLDIGIAVLAIAALTIFLFALDDGRLEWLQRAGLHWIGKI